MHKYQTRLHVIFADEMDEIMRNNREISQFCANSSKCMKRTFTFPETKFFAVTAYQNNRVITIIGIVFLFTYVNLYVYIFLFLFKIISVNLLII